MDFQVSAVFKLVGSRIFRFLPSIHVSNGDASCRDDGRTVTLGAGDGKGRNSSALGFAPNR